MAGADRIPDASVIIPAHNEARVLERCLRSLTADPAVDLEIIVVANGCTDQTADIARTHPGVKVIELAVASKNQALNAGDEIASTFPRFYLDADIELVAGATRGLVTALSTTAARVAAPMVCFDTSQASWPVRRFYEVYEELPYVSTDLTGLGVYGLSAAGRQRFGQFPALLADDLFVQRLFTSAERVTSQGRFLVQVPRDLATLVGVRTRTATGNKELSRLADVPDMATPEVFGSTTGTTLGALGRLLLRRPARLPGVGVYVLVVTWARLRARQTQRTAGVWHRDESSR